MSFRGLLLRTFGDLLDIPNIVVAFLVTFTASTVVSPPLVSALADFLLAYADTFSILKSVEVFVSSLFNPAVLLSLLITIILNVYLVSFVVSRVWQRRTGSPSNPFRRAFERMPHTFIALVLVSLLPTIFLVLYALYQTSNIGPIFLFLFVLSLILWVPLTFPVVASAVVEEGRGRDIVYEGMLAGRIYWLRILVAVLIISLFVSLLSYLLGPVLEGEMGTYAVSLVQAVTIVLTVSLSAEAYHAFKHGE